MDAVIRVRQKTLAVDAYHLLCNHLFFFPIQPDLAADSSTAEFVLQTFG